MHLRTLISEPHSIFMLNFVEWIFLHLRYRNIHETIRTKLSPFIRARVQWKRENPKVSQHLVMSLACSIITYYVVFDTQRTYASVDKLCDGYVLVKAGRQVRTRATYASFKRQEYAQ